MPNLVSLLQPILTMLQPAIVVIASIILIWIVIEEWTNNPGRFSWFAVLWKSVSVGLIAFFLYNAQTILQRFITATPA